MSEGKVESIHVAPEPGAPMHALQEAQLMPDLGIVGDRKYARAKSGRQRPEAALTLIEAEAVEAASQDYEIPLDVSETRRSVVTRGIALNHLVGRTFRVGNVRCIGTELCEPCGHLQKLTRDGVLRALIHRGGIRANILDEGTIRPGDIVRPD